MGMDAMLVVHQCERHNFADAKFFRGPDAPLDPTVWVDKHNALCAWHPLIDTLESDSTTKWDQDAFNEAATILLDALREHIFATNEAEGLPNGYYSNYPKVVADIRCGRSDFTEAATDEHDKQVEQAKPKKPATPKLDALLTTGKKKARKKLAR